MGIMSKAQVQVIKIIMILDSDFQSFDYKPHILHYIVKV